MVETLASEGEQKTKELQKRLYPDYDDKYSTDRTFWNSISRDLETIDGIENPY